MSKPTTKKSETSAAPPEQPKTPEPPKLWDEDARAIDAADKALGAALDEVEFKGDEFKRVVNLGLKNLGLSPREWSVARDPASGAIVPVSKAQIEAGLRQAQAARAQHAHGG